MEVIQRINIFIELLAVYYHFIRENISELPKAIGKNEFPLSSEYKLFNNQKRDDIFKNFKYPNVEKFTEITTEEKKFLSEILEESANNTIKKFKEVYKFKRHFTDVYNKYKHVMSEVTGIFGLDKNQKIFESRVYVRHKIVNQKETRYNVYAIPLSSDTIEYFEKVSRATRMLLLFLIENQLLTLSNQGRDIIPRHLSIDKEKRNKLTKIVKKITSYKRPNINAVIRINPPVEETTFNKISKAYQENNIYLMKNDIFDIGTLKKGSIARI